MHVEVKDPDDKEILSRVYSAEGKQKRVFICNAFICNRQFLCQANSHLRRTHRENTQYVCTQILHSGSVDPNCAFILISKWANMLLITHKVNENLKGWLDNLIFILGDFYCFPVAQKEKLTELQLRIRQLLNQVDQITKEQNYQRVCLNKQKP